MRSETPLSLWGEIRQHSLQTDLRKLPLLLLVARGVEVELVDHRAAQHPLGRQDEIEGLTDGGLADAVSAHQRGLLIQQYRSAADAPEILQLQAPYLHVLRLLTASHEAPRGRIEHCGRQLPLSALPGPIPCPADEAVILASTVPREAPVPPSTGALSYLLCKMEDCLHTTVRRQLGTVALKGERLCSSVIFTVMTTSIW